jgi:hypothetical protein
MKTITYNNTNISVYIFEDDDDVTLTEKCIVCPQIIRNCESSFLYVREMNSNNSTIHLDVTPPEDWEADKYYFDGSNWTLKT